MVINSNSNLGYNSNIATGCFVGLEDNPDVVSSSVYPNPNSYNFTITYQLQPNRDGYLEIYNPTGKRIYKSQLPVSSTHQQIRLPNMANGVYDCVITSNNSRTSKKTVILYNIPFPAFPPNPLDLSPLTTKKSLPRHRRDFFYSLYYTFPKSPHTQILKLQC